MPFSKSREPISSSIANKPTFDSIVFAVLCFMVLLATDIEYGHTRTWNYTVDPPRVVRCSYGAPVLAEHRLGFSYSEGLADDIWVWYPASGIVVALALAAVCCVLVRVARLLCPKGSISSPLAKRLAVFWALAFLSVAIFYKTYWGYWFAPPTLNKRITTAVGVTAIGGFRTATSGRRAWNALAPGRLPQATPGRLTEYPLNDALYRLKAAGLSFQTPSARSRYVEAIRKMPFDPRFRVKNEKGFHSQTWTAGFWAELQGRDRQRYLFVAANGGEVSDGHHPHYRLLYRPGSGDSLHLVEAQVMFYDVAGNERLTWGAWFFGLGLAGSWAALVLAFVHLAEHRKSARRHDRDQPAH